MLCSRSKSSIRADRLGVDEATAAQATRAALATLVQGMQANARDRAAEASLAEAMSQHARRISERGEPDVDSAETQDGARIVSHVFGDSEGQVVNQLGGLTGGSDLFKKLLPMLAPLVMGFLAKQFSSRRDGSDATTGDDGSRGFGDVLGGLLGGAGGSASGGGLSDLLGGLLGDSGSAGGGSLDDLLAACSVEVAADGPGWWS